MNTCLWPRTGSLRVPVAVYSAALLAMALTILDQGSLAAAAGGIPFLVSDSLLALRKFSVTDLPGGDGLVTATYCAAQALLAASTT